MNNEKFTNNGIDEIVRYFELLIEIDDNNIGSLSQISHS